MREAFQPVPLDLHDDHRGTLIAFEESAPLPFEPKRVFLIEGVEEPQVRAEHAVSCDQFLVLLRASCRITLRTREHEDVFELTALRQGLFVPAGVWLRLDRFEAHTSLLVFASALYRETQYFRNPQL